VSAVSQSRTSATALGHVPSHQRLRILSGMRWSLWLSGIAVPFGAAINLLLARVGPETIGFYGLLSVYVGLITSFLYFGGDTVIMKFTPECDANDHASFLVSYLVVIFLFLAPFVAIGYLCPAAIRLVLGKDLDDQAGVLLLCLAPVPIVFQMVTASLKGMLEIKASQVLAKSLAILTLCAYGIISVIARSTLTQYPRIVIWGIYFGCAALLAMVGAVRIYRSCSRKSLRFYLPVGFWRYAVDTQAVSTATFLSGRLDYVLILNYGGLGTLGRYVAIMAVAASVALLSTLFMDTLLPSLTNMVAARNEKAAAQVFVMHMRILFLVTVGVSCGIIVLGECVTWIMGPQYASVAGLLVVATLLQGMSVPGTYGGTLLASVGRQRVGVATSVLKALMFCAIFLTTWSHWLLAAAVLANGLAALASSIALMGVAQRGAPFYPSVTGLWIKAAFVQSAVAAVALWCMPLGPLTGIVTWIAGIAAFLNMGKYDVHELKRLMQIFMLGSAKPPALAPRA
jgi:O-antigen/teichoic acid export membrane protein